MSIPATFARFGGFADGTKARHRINVDPEEERSNQVLAQSQLTLTQCVLPPLVTLP